MSELEPIDKSHDIANVKISICGIPIKGGHGEDEVIRIVRKSPAFESVVGADGSVTRYRNRDDRADVTLILMQGADGNDALSALHNNDKNTPNGAGVGRFLVEDLNGRAIFEAAHCWIVNDPEATLGKTPTPREWQIELAQYKAFHGGNTSLP